MKPQLSQQEIAKLFDFVTSKFVRYEDLKYELVDHLASSIEDITEANPEATFDSALKETYGRFPITGFTNFVAERHTALNRYWMKKFFKYYIEFFKLPKIILLIALAYFFWSLYQYVDHDYLVRGTGIAVGLFTVTGIIKIMKNRKIGQRFLFMGVHQAQITFPNLIFFHLFINIRYENIADNNLSPTVIVILSIVSAFILLINYANNFVFPKILKEEVQNKYAHLNIKLA